MKRTLKNRQGFTMIELMAVVVIIAVLAIASVPIYQGNIKKAIRSEAIATLGAIRAAEKTYKAENNTYLVVTSSDNLATLGISVEDVQYFDASCYTVEVVAGPPATFIAYAKNTNSYTGLAGAPAKAKVTSNWAANSPVATMDQQGTVVEYP